jgi:hypothetical protein
MAESRQYEWLKMVCAALLEDKNINVQPDIGIEIVRRKAERVKDDILVTRSPHERVGDFCEPTAQ